MFVKILVENTPFDKYSGEHGLSVLIEYKGKKYLLDTGSSGMFAENASRMEIDLSEVEAGFLSHAHYDHSGGYDEFFEKNKTAKVYLQEAAKRKTYWKIAGPIKKYIGIPKGVQEKYEDRFVYIDGYKDFGNGIYILPHTTDGVIERAKHAHMSVMYEDKIQYDDFSHEQTVVFEEGDGLVCFNSCSHGGVENIIEEIKAVFPEKRIKMFIGGFHMMGLTGPTSCSYKKEEVQAVAQKLLDSSSAVFYSGHCTGSVAFEWLKEILGERLKSLYSGMVIEIN